MFAELIGRAAGYCKGRGGSMHIADTEPGILGANGDRRRRHPDRGRRGARASSCASDGRRRVAFFGDGAVGAGRLPRERSTSPRSGAAGRASSARTTTTPSSRPTADELAVRDVAALAAPATGSPASTSTATTSRPWPTRRATRSRAAAPATGPTLIEADTYRWHGHYEGDQMRYRTHEEVAEWARARPAAASPRARLDERRRRRRAIARRGRGASWTSAIEWADAQPVRRRRTLELRRRLRGRRVGAVDARREALARTMDASTALGEELERDPSVVLIGEDVGQAAASSASPRGLHDASATSACSTRRSPRRAIVGVGVGAAMAGLRPVVEMMFFDFVGAGHGPAPQPGREDALHDRRRASPVPLTVRTSSAAGRGSGAQHSQSLEACSPTSPG